MIYIALALILACFIALYFRIKQITFGLFKVYTDRVMQIQMETLKAYEETRLDQKIRIDNLATEVRIIQSVQEGHMTITPKKGANRRPRTEAEKAQLAQIKKDWWAKKKAQEKKTPTPEQATSEGKPS